MINHNYKICCIVPTKNQARYLRESLNSILNQTFKNFHLIIVDNNSTDNTTSILKEYEKKYKNSILPKVTIIKEMRPGTGAALNKGLSINNNTTKCPYLTWWASDNVLNNDAYYHLNDFLDKNLNIDMVYSNMDIHIVDKTGLNVIKVKNLQDEVGKQEWSKEKVFVNYYLGCIWLFRNTINEKAGSWYIHEPCEDYDQVIRFVFADANFKYLDMNLGWFRRHDENMSKKLKNTGYPENLVKNMIEIKKQGKGKDYIEFVRWKYNPEFYDRRKDYVFENWGNIMNDKKLFTNIYQNNTWGGKESVSGKGSDLEQTKRIINRVPHLLKKYNIKSIIDIGCGDLNWMKYILEQFPDIKYTGIDIVDELIENNKKNFPKYEFYSYNVNEKSLEGFNYDLIICRDVLPHLSFTSIISFLHKVAYSNCSYLLTSTFSRYDRQNKKDINLSKGVSWRAINMVKSPISLIDPIDNINERCTQIDTDGSNFKDKSLGLWKVVDIRKSLGLEVKLPKAEPLKFDRLKKNSKIPEKKEWYLKKIDKVINFYWGNRTLPYLRYLTLKTFNILNPDWTIHLYIPKNVSKKITWVSDEHKFEVKQNRTNNYFKELKSIKNLKIIRINDEKYKDFPEVFKSDILRWKLLENKSGVWSDMDIIFVRPMNECEFNTRQNENMDTGIQISRCNETYHTIGFMLSGGNNNDYFSYIKSKCDTSKVNFNNYQSLGVVLLNCEFPNIQKIKNKFRSIQVFNIDKELFYNFYPIERIQELYKVHGKDYTNNKTIGIHWYGGYKLSGEYCNRINHENIWKDECLLSKKIQEVLKLNEK